MSFAWYPTDGPRPSTPAELPEPIAPRFADAAPYQPSKDLADAVNVALALGQPLLLTGEPGCGKTQLASHLAWSLGMPSPLKFETKSDSTSAELFYVYDALRHYRASAIGEAMDVRDYIRLAPLGAAIVRTRPSGERHELDDDGPAEPVRSIVLIDEIDKAPRDFPNDVLNEIEQLYFRVPEIGLTVEADPTLRPIVVITSNQERDLPGPFLRRCVYHHVTFPDRAAVRDIVAAHLEGVRGLGPAADDIISAFSALRSEQAALRRKPGLSELLAWMAVLLDADDSSLDVEAAVRTVGTVAKSGEDVENARRELIAWDKRGRVDR